MTGRTSETDTHLVAARCSVCATSENPELIIMQQIDDPIFAIINRRQAALAIMSGIEHRANEDNDADDDAYRKAADEELDPSSNYSPRSRHRLAASLRCWRSWASPMAASFLTITR
jgi:hypothetical protein